MSGFVDIHCHLLHGVDDGARDFEESLAMARLLLDQGIDTAIATPHQGGAYSRVGADEIRRSAEQLQENFRTASAPLRVAPGAVVRVEKGLVESLERGDLLTLGDQGRHVLLGLPHETYLPLEPVLVGLRRLGMVGVLSQPERNSGLLQRPGIVEELVEQGCLMQVTSGSLLGVFGQASRAMAERMALRGAIHFIATDAHDPMARRPRMSGAFVAARRLAGERAATLWCREFPRAVVDGRHVPPGFVRISPPRRSLWTMWSRRSA